MDKSESAQFAEHIGSVVTKVLRNYPTNRDAPTLEGVPTAREEMGTHLASVILSAVRDYDERSERPAHFLARLALDICNQLHMGLCARQARAYRSCRRDSSAAQDAVDWLALSLFGLQFHGSPGSAIMGAANAGELTEVQRVDGLSAKLTELLHRHPSGREPVRVIEGSPVVQQNAPYRNVRGRLYDRNRATHLALAPIAEEFGCRTDLTSDYASPGHPGTGQEYQVRAGLFRCAAAWFIMNGAGPGTGRAIELVASTLAPILLLRRVGKDDPLPPNDDRYSGEVTGLTEMTFTTNDEARTIAQLFLISEKANIHARQNELEALATSGPREEEIALQNADASSFDGSRIRYEEAAFWVDRFHWPYAGEPRRSTIRKALGLTESNRNAKRAPVDSMELASVDGRSMSTLSAYSRIKNLGPERTLKLWENRHAYGPTTVRRDIAFAIEDWADVDRRTAP